MAISDTPEVTVATPGGQRVTVGMVASGYRMSGSRKGIVPVYDGRVLKYIAELTKERVASGFDCIILWTGERRAGKSTAALQAGQHTDKGFGIGNVAFRLEEFNDIIRTNPPADPERDTFPQVVLDEAGFDLFASNWMERVQRNMVRKFEVIGAKRQTVHLVLPHRMMLNKSFREGMVYLWVNVSTYESMRGFAELRLGQPNIWKLEMYWKPLCAFTFHNLDGVLWDQYQAKKMSFIEEVTSDIQDTPDTKATVRGQRDTLIRLCYEGHPKGMTLQEIADAIDMDRSRVGKIIAKSG